MNLTREQYRKALSRLRLRPHSREAAKALGMSRRQLTRVAAGDQQVPQPVYLLLGMYLRHGLPDEFSPTCATRRGER